MAQVATMTMAAAVEATASMALERGRSARAERALWRALRDRRLGGVEFLRRRPVGPYVVDFFAPDLRLVVELDEPRDLFAGDRDEQRAAHLASFGVRTVRLKVAEVEADLEEGLRRVAEAVRTIRDLS